jgi:hypothetical protein
MRALPRWGLTRARGDLAGSVRAERGLLLLLLLLETETETETGQAFWLLNPCY